MSSSLGILIPLAIFTVGPISWAFTTWVRAKHGYPLDDNSHGMWGWRGASVGRGRRDRNAALANDAAAERKIELLSSENEALTGKISHLEERLSVLERIATDPAERTAREIEALRDR